MRVRGCARTAWRPEARGFWSAVLGTRVCVSIRGHMHPQAGPSRTHTPRLAGLAFTNNHSTPPSLHPLPSTESAWRVMVIAILAGTI